MKEDTKFMSVVNNLIHRTGIDQLSWNFIAFVPMVPNLRMKNRFDYNQQRY